MSTNRTDDLGALREQQWNSDSHRDALEARLAYYTTVAGARAACAGLLGAHEFRPYQLQQLHTRLAQQAAGHA